MTQRKTADYYPRRDGEMLREEKISILKSQIEDGNYETVQKFDKIIDTFVSEFVR